MITRMIDFGFNVQQVIEAPRWQMRRTWGTLLRDLLLEPQIPAEVTRELTLRGHPVKMATAWNGSLGHALAIRLHAVPASIKTVPIRAADGNFRSLRLWSSSAGQKDALRQPSGRHEGHPRHGRRRMRPEKVSIFAKP